MGCFWKELRNAICGEESSNAPIDVSTMQYIGASDVVPGFTVNTLYSVNLSDDGLYVYVHGQVGTDRYLIRGVMSVASDISTVVWGSIHVMPTMTGSVDITGDGTRLVTGNNGTSAAFLHTLSIPFDTTSGTYEGSVSTGVTSWNPHYLPDGSAFVTNTWGVIRKHSLISYPGSWNVSDQVKDLLVHGGGSYVCAFNSDGLKMLTADTLYDELFVERQYITQYELSAPYDISTLTQTHQRLMSDYYADWTLQGICFKHDDSGIYCTGFNNTGDEGRKIKEFNFA